MSNRPRPLTTWLSVFALLLQLVLPTAHAQAWAQRAGAPMLYAMCGQLPAMQQLGNRVADSALPLEWQQSQKKLAALSCELCGAVHATPLAGAPAAGLVFISQARRYEPAQLVPCLVPAKQHVVLPPLRGPPVLV